MEIGLCSTGASRDVRPVTRAVSAVAIAHAEPRHGQARPGQRCRWMICVAAVLREAASPASRASPPLVVTYSAGPAAPARPLGPHWPGAATLADAGDAGRPATDVVLIASGCRVPSIFDELLSDTTPSTRPAPVSPATPRHGQRAPCAVALPGEDNASVQRRPLSPESSQLMAHSLQLLGPDRRSRRTEECRVDRVLFPFSRLAAASLRVRGDAVVQQGRI